MEKASMKDPLGRVRLVGRVEGVSFLLLLGVAMPLKYIAGQPMAVSIVGWAHGVLFVLLALLVLIALIDKKLSFAHSVLVMVAALLPFGPFVVDKRIGSAHSGG